INSKWQGLAPKFPQGGGDGNTFYQELGYMFAHINAAVKYQNATAHLLGFQPGVGTTSVEGTGATAQQFQDFLSEAYGPPHRGPVIPLGPRLPGGIPLPDPAPGKSAPIVAVPDVPTHPSLIGGLHR
ncbi:MAG TPA: hypothetical protein VH008_04800, partial [Pseudonocardia sp.]|nr:hypothetical protein [Pseudonocardia sp.]